MSMSSSVSGYTCSRDPDLSTGYGELDLGKGFCWATWASHFVSLPNKLSVLSKKSLSVMFKIGIVTGSSGGMFSLSELMFLGSLKIMGLYSNSVRVGGHGPESEVILESFILSGEKESNLLELMSSSLVCLSHGQYFSVLFSPSSFNACLPSLVLIWRTNSIASMGMSHVKKPLVKLLQKFSVLAIF